MLSKVYVDGFGLDIVLTRSFSHIGPGHRDVFVFSSFAKQLVEIKKYNRPAEIITGDLSITRDFLDVRDVVKAYHTLFKQGIKGEVYNICSGEGITLGEIIKKMGKILELNVKTITDNNLRGPNDNSIIIGSNKKITKETSWKIAYSLEQSLIDIIDYWYQLA